jgi:hypothetical protein
VVPANSCHEDLAITDRHHVTIVGLSTRTGSISRLAAAPDRRMACGSSLRQPGVEGLDQRCELARGL